MSDPLETLKLLADPTRLRVVALLAQEELSVAELQEILGMGQSRISSHLSLLRKGGLTTDRRDGKRSFYSLARNLPTGERQLIEAACRATANQPELETDAANLARILDKRRRQAEQYFSQVAGRLGKNYCPGRSWEGIGHFLLHLTPRIKIADLGAGEGVLAQLLAQRAESVYCIDNSKKMVEVGTDLAKRHGIDNLYYQHGDIEDVPLEDASVDLAYLSQALHHARKPFRALSEAHRILKPGGRIIVLDLKEHTFERARDLYADAWLGFAENTLYQWLKELGFEQVDVSVVAREEQEPYFETLLASGVKA
ncbi:metalloregulator ArsR/SmtB family transcription factor [Ruficoccus sp. ZRK36]|uniref:ArsR/SmtB family transcription factor n=1 Tax=Ruficoccus sp. ZRK36 TaxID=2866311 RepID=UPI001C731AEB|nr:metalloregulator ArsR/SmtB family transcription factor [Ruficoccus sp. ZRK36]QYY36919.1 metalloregulator ArsR/SmtB family transcription factor [Ruficoccus sp. ZRK36]